jgi:hypothetical protein
METKAMNGVREDADEVVELIPEVEVKVDEVVTLAVVCVVDPPKRVKVSNYVTRGEEEIL